jgi:hypothetical protein
VNQKQNEVATALLYWTDRGALCAKEIARNSHVYFLPLSFHLAKNDEKATQEMLKIPLKLIRE